MLNARNIPLNEEFLVTQVNRKTDRILKMSLMVVHARTEIKVEHLP